LSEGIALAYGAHAKGLSPLKPTLLFKTQPHERRAFQATTWRRLKTLPDRAPTFISISTQKCRDRYKMAYASLQRKIFIERIPIRLGRWREEPSASHGNFVQHSSHRGLHPPGLPRWNVLLLVYRGLEAKDDWKDQTSRTM